PDNSTPQAIEKRILKPCGKFGDRRVEIDGKMSCQSFKLSAVVALHSFRSFPPRSDGAVRKRPLRIRDDKLRIKESFGSQSLACRTCAGQTIEREMLGVQFR